MIHELPGDIMIAILEYLALNDLTSLSLTCRSLYQLVEEFGWKNHIRLNPRLYHSFKKSFETWSARDQVRLRALTDRNWDHNEFIARPLSQRWAAKLQPLLTINPSRLVLAAGTTIYTYGFCVAPSPKGSPPVQLECTYSTSALHPNRDITALTSVPDGGEDRTVFVAYADGALERLVLAECSKSRDPSIVLKASWERYDLQNGLIESLSASSSSLLSLSSTGSASLLSLNSAEPTHSIIDLDRRSWCCFLSMHSSSPYAAFGTTAVHALSVHNVLPSHIAPLPFAWLDSSPTLGSQSAVYAITSSPASSPWGASDQVIISGWYDGTIRVHDLRSSTRAPSHGNRPPSLLPVLAFEDPWSLEPIYSLCSGGGSDAHVVAGSARHSVLAFWDVRNTSKGWSVHAPGNDSSPVYSVATDGPRVFGANESRGFVLDFGGGVVEETYPHIPIDVVPTNAGRGRWGRPRGGATAPRKETRVGPGFYVTKYTHSKM